MITGFLFFSKMIEGRDKKIDWVRLYISRVLRLVPLYLCVMLIMLVIIFVISKGVINESTLELIKNILRWLSFTILGGPDVNGVNNTYIIVSGVTWSLPYEWMFYFSLPVLAMAVGVKAPKPYIILGALCISYASLNPRIHYLSFVGGVAAAILVRFPVVRKFAVRKISSIVAITCLLITIIEYPAGFGVGPLFLLSIFFILVASGNSLFGLLIAPVTRTLGEFAYSIYLMHGIILFVTFNFVLGLQVSSSLTAIEHWAVVMVVTPIIICISCFTYTFIEKPALQKTNNIADWSRSRLGEWFKRA